MPKSAADALIWIPERNAYELHEQGGVSHFLQERNEEWLRWLAACSSFSFQGKYGQLTLRKESRPRGKGYWYAYRNQGHKTAKRYIGRSTDLTVARLEKVAQILGASPIETRRLADKRRRYKDADDARQLAPLLIPKLQLPRLHTSLIRRQRLLARLEAGVEHRLTVLSAPAGFGKTTLVSQWLSERLGPGGDHQHQRPIAWVSLDSGDNDPVRFWRYVITACQAFQVALGKAALTLLSTEFASWRSSFRQPILESTLTALLNELALLPGRKILVLEDYHLITSPQIHETLAYFIEHLPAALHLVIITRNDPPLPLARMRARDDLIELHAADLHFSRQEIAAFLQQSIPFPLTPEAIQRLEARTEGWVTALRLVSLALQERMSEEEIERFLASFTGSQRHLLEYFVNEVLGAQPEPLQVFLLQTSILGRLTASLCDAITARQSSEQLLKTLERANLFLQPLDGTGQWYRFHALFAEAMLHEARHRLGEEALRLLYSRASSWHEQHDTLTEAIDAALSAGDFARVALLIEKFTGQQRHTEAGELYTLRGWLERIPEAIMQRHPSLCFFYAIALAFSDQYSGTNTNQPARFLRMAEDGWQAESNLAKLGEVLAFRSLMVLWQGENAQAAALARQAIAWLPEEEYLWRGAMLGIVGGEEMLVGQLDAARKTILLALPLCEAAGNRYAVRPTALTLADIYREQGELRQAGELYRQILAEVQDDLADKERALFGLAQLAYEWNELETAQQLAEEALELGRRLADETRQVHSSLILARVLCAREESGAARQILQTLLARVRLSQSSLFQREVLLCQAQLSLSEGDFPAVQRWADVYFEHNEDLPPAQQEREALLMGRLLIAQAQAEEALPILNGWLAAARDAGRWRNALAIQVLLSVAYFAQKRTWESRRLLRETLTQASSEDYRRLFLDEGGGITALLRDILPEVRERPLIIYIQSLLQAFRQPARVITAAPLSALLTEPLSLQEQRVLRLLAAGQSRQEIARELVVSINTVKTHLQRIYRKLNVSSRPEAREAARHLHLL